MGFDIPDTPRAAYSAILDAQPPLVDLVNPATSRILHAREHTAAALKVADSDAVLAWIQAEIDAHDPAK